MNEFIMWSFPLILATMFLTGTVSKPDMPHITLPDAPPAQIEQADFQVDVLADMWLAG